MILAVIPARGGSKGMPRKNLRLLCGKPLIAWTIEAARASRLLDRCVVSTEDLEIATVARVYGAEVLDRPEELASDDASTLSVLQHALERLDAGTIVVLQPTSPIRSPGLIDRCIERFRAAGADSLATGFCCKYVEYAKNDLRRQDINGFFYDDGNVYVIRGSLILQGDRYGKNIEYLQTSRPENIDIDEEFDLWLAEKVLLDSDRLFNALGR
jgi:CMP-N-acetylneuraminic acid synthetase